MKRKRFFCIRAALALILIFSLALPVFAQTEIRSDEEYTFTGEEFSEWEDLRGIFITGLSDGRFRLLLGNRVILPGDVIAGEDLARLRLRPVADEDAEASVRFLPICGEGLGEEAVFTMHVQKSSDEPPEARDMKLETYRNLPNSAVLRAKDDGDGPLTFQLKDKPTRGTVELSADGSFTYTPKKNKVGEDSFTYTVTDEAGNLHVVYVVDMVPEGKTAPLDYCEERIRDLILSSRKHALEEGLAQDLLENARKNNKFVIYDYEK